MSLLLLLACIDDTASGADTAGSADAGTVTALGSGDGELDASAAEWEEIIGKADKLSDPRDLGFDPDGNLWVANRKDDRTFIVSSPGEQGQTVDRRQDGYAEHFMEETSAMAFEDTSGADTFGNEFGTCGESRNTYNEKGRPDDFMGPVLWSADLEIFAEENPEGLGSHLDMLHETSLCVGMAWEADNVYWVFDGQDSAVMRYDFQENHTVGQDDHSDGIVYQMSEPEVTRVEDAPGHMEIDRETGILYIADTGAGRVLWLDTASGEQGKKVRGAPEPLANNAMWDNVSWGELITDLDEPGGLALDGEGNLYVSDFATGVIHAYDLEGKELQSLDTKAGEGAIYGIEIGPDGALWVTNAAEAAVLRLNPRG
jgi:DNA-binding beta-propeller fold protein YncE